MKKILILLAQKGFEEVEALTPADYLRRVGAKVDMISLGDSKIVRGAHQIQIVTDGILKDISSENYDCIILPGGMPGASILQKDDRVIRIVEEFERNGKVIAAICAAPIVLDKAGVLKDRYYTCYPGVENEICFGKHVNKSVVKDETLITAKGPYLAGEFALKICETLFGTSIRNKLENEILFRSLDI